MSLVTDNLGSPKHLLPGDYSQPTFLFSTMNLSGCGGSPNMTKLLSVILILQRLNNTSMKQLLIKWHFKTWNTQFKGCTVTFTKSVLHTASFHIPPKISLTFISLRNLGILTAKLTLTLVSSLHWNEDISRYKDGLDKPISTSNAS